MKSTVNMNILKRNAPGHNFGGGSSLAGNTLKTSAGAAGVSPLNLAIPICTDEVLAFRLQGQASGSLCCLLTSLIKQHLSRQARNHGAKSPLPTPVVQLAGRRRSAPPVPPQTHVGGVNPVCV